MRLNKSFKSKMRKSNSNRRRQIMKKVQRKVLVRRQQFQKQEWFGDLAQAS